MFEQRLHRQFELTAHWGVRMLYEKNPRLISLAWKIELIVTSLAKEVMFLVALVSLSVCLSVCLFVCL